MKLELKHIAPYLPYGLKCNAMGEFTEDTEYMDKPVPEIFRLNGLVNGQVSIKNGRYVNLIPIEEAFPILRPLSDMTKEYINDQEINFIDAVYSSSWITGGYDLGVRFDRYILHEKDGSDEIVISTTKPHTNMWWITDMMFEWHFDVFGLIEKGLAININEIK